MSSPQAKAPEEVRGEQWYGPTLSFSEEGDGSWKFPESIQMCNPKLFAVRFLGRITADWPAVPFPKITLTSKLSFLFQGMWTSPRPQNIPTLRCRSYASRNLS
jgi:hypothetical protein